MQDLCPLCLKNGTKKKIKLLQINLQEAVWMCEEEKCPWPLGYEDFVFCSRIAGKIWSCYWDDQKMVPKVKETFLMPTKNLPTDCVPNSSLDANLAEDINVNNVNKDFTDSLSFKNSYSQLVTNDTENLKSKNSLGCKGIPKITSIEKTNINISNVMVRSHSTTNKNLHESLVNINESTNDARNKLRFSSNNFNDGQTTEFTLNANVMETDNATPITVSIKIPKNFISENVMSNTMQSNYRSNSKNSSTSETKCSSVKRNLTSGKQYEKFSFSALKNKLKENNTLNIKTENASTLKSNNTIKGTESDTTISTFKENLNKNIHNNGNYLNGENNSIQPMEVINIACNNTIKQSNDSVMASDVSNIESTTNTILNSYTSFDSVLDELLNNDYSVSEEINEDWINSLLSEQ